MWRYAGRRFSAILVATKVNEGNGGSMRGINYIVERGPNRGRDRLREIRGSKGERAGRRAQERRQTESEGEEGDKQRE